MIILDDLRKRTNLVELYLTAHASDLVGAILIPGWRGIKNPKKIYPEFWHWPEFQDGSPKGFLNILNDPQWSQEKYGFHEQLWVGVFHSPSSELTFLCTQLEKSSFEPVLEQMLSISAQAEIYPSPFDMYDLLEDMGQQLEAREIRSWQNPWIFEHALNYLIVNYFLDLPQPNIY